MSILDALANDSKGEKRTYGVAAGLITNNQDPDGEGRVKLKFPWLSDANETDWVRIATFMAGGGRGSFFLPEVGDEVLVAFEHGDINRPFVIGFLWNGKDKPPETNSDGKNNIRKIKSRSGHEIVLNDEAGKEKVEIKSKGGHAITLDDTSGSETVLLKDKNGNEVKLTQSAIEVTGSMQLKIKASSIELSADTTMTIKAGATLTLQGALIKIN